MKLALGTVQFGIEYGITNQSGKTSLAEVARILEYAKGKINVLDTAPSYGVSERSLGENNLQEFNVITKTPYIENNCIEQRDLEKIEKYFFQSLEYLNTESVYGLLIHNSGDMLKKGAEYLYKKIWDFKKQGYIEKIGISVYNQMEIDLLCNEYSFDIIQIPINVLDQRLVKSGTLKRLKEKNIEIHARSIFLQGVLLNEISTLNSKFNEVIPLLSEYFSDLKKNNLTKIEGALSYINTINEIDRTIVGVNDLKQLDQIYNTYVKIRNEKRFCLDYAKYSCDKEKIIDPRKW
jgi:aryl-alcohol dehydrogenase-like predicted oxidoreductase